MGLAINFVWATLERLLPRASSAGLMLLASALVLPPELGIYSWGLLIFTFCQASFDATIRQIAVGMVSTASGDRFIRSYSHVYALAGPALIASCLFTLYLLLDREITVLQLAPLIFAPLPVAMSTARVAALQARGEWAFLSRAQGVASLVSVTLSLPLLLFTGSVSALTVQITLIELVLFFLVRRRKLSTISLSDPGLSATQLQRQYWSVFSHSLTSWIQGQLDRLMVGVVAGTATLGLYTFASSVSRGLADPVGLACANMLRADIRKIGPDRHRLREAVNRVLVMGMVATLLVSIASMGLGIGLSFVLDPEWIPALRAIPALAATTVPVVYAWIVTVLIVHDELTLRVLPTRIVTIALALVIAIAALVSLELAAWAAFARALVNAIMLSAIAHRTALTARGAIIACGATAIACAAALALGV